MTRLTYLGIACRILLGILWLVAAAFKASDLGGFQDVLRHEYALPHLLLYLALFVPPLETLIGLALLLEFRVREALWATIALLGGFCLVIVWGMLGGSLESCGCLGGFADLSPPLAIVRNILCMLAAYAALRFEPAPPSLPWKGWIIGAACTVVALATGTSVEEPHFAQPSLVNGENLPDLGVEIPGLNDGPLALFVFKAGCGKCWDALPQIRTLQGEPRLKIVGITPSRPDEVQVFQNALRPEFPIVSISQETYEQLDLKIPAVLFLNQGILQNHLEGRVPTLESIQHFSEAWFNRYLDGQPRP